MKMPEITAIIKKVPISSSLKLSKIRIRLIEYILKNDNPKQIIERIDQIADQLIVVRSRNKERCDSVWRHLIEVLFAENKQLILLNYYKHVSIDDFQDKKKEAQWNIENGIYNGRKRALIEFYKLLGGSVDYTIIFCLSLFDIFHAYLERSGSGKFPPKVGELIDEEFLAAYQFLFSSVALPERKEVPLSLWFHNLLKYAEHNKAAAEIFRFIMATLTDGGSRHIQIKDLSYASLDECLLPLGNFNELIRKPVWAISSQEEKILVDRLVAQEAKKNLMLLKNGERIYSWFLENREKIGEEKLRKSREIVERPSRGLRSNGADHINIKISVLYASGIRAVAFYPNGCQFPDIKVKVMAMKWTPHPIAFQGEFGSFHLSISDAALENSSFKDYEKLRELLEYIIVDALHRIIVVQQEKKGEATKKDGKAAVYESERASEVRPHFRRLPEGWQASEEAKGRAESQQGWILPPGKTYVQGHYRNGQIEYDIATEPIMVYDDEFLMGTV